MSPLPSGRPNCQKPVQPPAWTLFKLDLSSCENCGGQVRAIASLEDPLVIGEILAYLETRRPMLVGEGCRPEVRGPPQGALGPGLLSGGRRAC